MGNIVNALKPREEDNYIGFAGAGENAAIFLCLMRSGPEQDPRRTSLDRAM